MQENQRGQVVAPIPLKIQVVAEAKSFSLRIEATFLPENSMPPKVGPMRGIP